MVPSSSGGSSCGLALNKPWRSMAALLRGRSRAWTSNCIGLLKFKLTSSSAGIRDRTPPLSRVGANGAHPRVSPRIPQNVSKISLFYIPCTPTPELESVFRIWKDWVVITLQSTPEFGWGYATTTTTHFSSGDRHAKIAISSMAWGTFDEGTPSGTVQPHSHP